ncbi:4-hydroxybenzoate 3-monooxygenase [Cryptosporangium sp. NPDC048952]|uniref:4-hydroxybenzoate 3-monooxygenase n=1 Tax=Cryptosporangium sp. NPDC048952 TaxID=3363961 RepID=UPI00371E7AD2
MRTRTQVGIIGAGPAGLLLQHLLTRAGVDSVVVENRSREYCEKRQRAGVLEHGTVELLKEIGLGDRMMREGLLHSGIYLQFGGERHHLDFPSLTGGRTLTVYAQTEVVKDAIAVGHPIHFEVSDTAVHDIDTERPILSFTDKDGVAQELECDVIAGCDGFHGVSRPSMSGLRVSERTYPFAWLGILSPVPPSTDELIYAHSPQGFAMHSMRSPEVSRLYLQVDPDEKIENWSDDRIWEQLQVRLGHPGWTLTEGPITEKSITPMRSFVAEPMRQGRLFLAGDAAHIVPPTGAKGLNLAVADVKVLSDALVRLLVEGKADLADAYSDTCLTRVWRSTWFSWFMTSMLHKFPVSAYGSAAEAEFQERLQIAQLRQVTSSTAAATNLAENYAGWPLP